jgi:MFS family permease
MATTSDVRLRDVALPAFGPTVVSSLGHGAIMPVVALQARALGATVGEAAGALVARVGEKRALTLVGVGEALLLLAAWRTTHLPLFAVLLFGVGMATTVFLQARQGFIIDAFPATHRARAMSTLGGTHRVGLLAGPLLGAGLIHLYGLASVFALAAAASLLSALVVQSMPDIAPAERRGRATASVLSVLRRHRRDLLTYGSAVAVISAARSLRVVLVPLWAEHVGLSPAATSLIIGIAAAVDVSLFYPAGWVMDRFGRAYVALPVVASAAVGCLLLPLADSYAGVLAVAVLIAAGNGLGSGIVMTMGADTAPEQGRAQYLGGWRLAGDVGGLGAPAALSALAALLPLGAACLVLGVTGLAGTVWATGWAHALDRRRAAALASATDRGPA